MPSTGITAGNSRAARIARWLRARPARAELLRVAATEGDEQLTLGEWTGPSVVPELAAELDGMCVDYATNAGARRRYRLTLHGGEDGPAIATHTCVADPDKSAVELGGGDEEFDGSSTSVAVELQRHMEVKARLDAARDANYQQAIQQVMDSYGNVVQLLTDTVDRFAERIVRQEQRADDATAELDAVKAELLEEAQDAAAEEQAQGNAEQVGQLVMGIAGKMLAAKAGGSAPTTAAPEAPKGGSDGE